MTFEEKLAASIRRYELTNKIEAKMFDNMDHLEELAVDLLNMMELGQVEDIEYFLNVPSLEIIKPIIMDEYKRRLRIKKMKRIIDED